MVASVEESSDDTSSYVSVHINDDKSSMDEPEWQTVQPNIKHKKRMSAKERKDLKNVQRSERSATEFAEGQNTVAEVAESFLRNLWTENDELNDDFTDEVVYFNPDGVSAKGRTMEELITAWTEAQDKRKQEIDVLDEIASQYRGSGRVEDLIRQGKISMQQRSDATFHRIVDLATRVRNTREHQMLEAEQLMRQRQESPELSNQKDEVREERCFFSEPGDSGFSNLILNFSEDAEHEEAKYRRMDMVVDSGAFVSGVPPEYYPEYKIDEMYEGQAEGGKSASGETLPILGIRLLQVSLTETVKDLTMNVKVIKGLSKALGAVSEMVANNCRVVFDSESKGGSYIWNRNRDEYYKVFPHNGIYTMPVWVRIPANFDDDEKNS